MRRIIFLAVFLVLAMVNTSFAKELVTPQVGSDAPKVMSITGKIKDISTSGVLVASDEKNMGDVLAKVFDSTYIYNSEDNQFTNLTALKVGQKVTVYHSAAMTRSIPPQTTSFAIVTGSGHKLPRYYRVDTATEMAKGVEFLTANNSLIVRSNSIQKAINSNDELLVWHGPVAMSFPGQTNATKIINLSSMKKGKITLHLEAGVLAVNSQEIQVTQAKAKNDAYRIYKQGKSYMLPLEPVAKALGLELSVDIQAEKITVINGSEKIEMVLGSKKYLVAGDKIELNAAPKEKFGQTMLPMEFFSKLLNINVELLNTPI